MTLDLDMPEMEGLATLSRIRALGSTPVIILSTHSGKGAPQTIEALHRGATDFIDKQRYSWSTSKRCTRCWSRRSSR